MAEQGQHISLMYTRPLQLSGLLEEFWMLRMLHRTVHQVQVGKYSKVHGMVNALQACSPNLSMSRVLRRRNGVYAFCHVTLISFSFRNKRYISKGLLWRIPSTRVWKEKIWRWANYAHQCTDVINELIRHFHPSHSISARWEHHMQRKSARVDLDAT